VQLGYFAQHHTEALDPSRTILDEVHRLVPTQPQSWVRSVLGSFLFSGDDVDKRISVLSGGERARVSLAKLLVVPSNLLLLDEPTNHLDLDSSEALIEALQGYDGTLLFVSHNRSFVNGLATHVWEVKEGKLDAQPGDLDDWQRRRTAEQEAEKVRTSLLAAAVDGESRGGAGKEARRERAQERERRAKLLGPLQKEVVRIEARIAALEAERKAAETQLADPAVFADPVRSRPLVGAYRAAGEELEELMAAWEEKQAALEAATRAAEMS
jgi:ATP-binding cassette subfamily F protein 3